MYFVKLHCHGVWEPSQEVLLGDPMVRFHEELQRRSDEDPSFRFHYVTAREMANIALAADGNDGLSRNLLSMHECRSFRYS